VVAAALAGGQAEAARHLGVARHRPAQVDHGGQILLPLGRDPGDTRTLDSTRDTVIRRGDVISMAWLGTASRRPGQAPARPCEVVQTVLMGHVGRGVTSTPSSVTGPRNAAYTSYP
jgi:hypothetical protein